MTNDELRAKYDAKCTLYGASDGEGLAPKEEECKVDDEGGMLEADSSNNEEQKNLPVEAPDSDENNPVEVAESDEEKPVADLAPDEDKPEDDEPDKVEEPRHVNDGKPTAELKNG